MSDIERTKTCNKCGETKTINNFSKHSGTKDKLDNRCKQCVNKLKQERKEKAKEEIKEYKVYSFDMNSTEWQIGKPSGSILHRIDNKSKAERYEVRTKVDGKSKSKSFAFKSFNNSEEARNAAEKHLIEFSNLHNLTRNRVRKVDENTIEVELTQNMIMKTDMKHLDTCQKYTIVSTKNGHANSEYYAAISIGNKLNGFHNHITGFEMVDHINRDPMDNRKQNL